MPRTSGLAGRPNGQRDAIDANNVIRAFSAEHVTRLTGLSKGQLRYWDRTGFFRPRFAFEDRSKAFSRIYSFRDLVGLRTLALLRKEHKVSLQHLRKVAEKLSHLKESLWSETVLYVFKKEVVFLDPESDKLRHVVSGQYVVNVPLREIISDMASASAKLRERTKKQIGRIERHRSIAHNAWVVAGTRISVAIIRRFADAGYSAKEIVREYPILTERDVKAALAYREPLDAAA